MFSRFFINRPIFASVISIVICLAGGITIFFLPIEQFPNITPPTVEVSTVYPGASAQVLADTVTATIEEQVNGVDDMIYMSSRSSSDGRMSLTVTFEVGTDIDMATVLVQNRVSIAMPRLPDEVKRQGVTVKKKSTNMVLLVNLTSKDGSSSELVLSNLALTQIKDELARVDGVGEVQILGAKNYSIRLWLDPELLSARNLTTSEVLAAIREQNVQVAAGQIGQTPSPDRQDFQYNITTLGRLQDVEQFENIIVKTGRDGRMVRLKDISRVEEGAENYDWASRLDNAPAASLAVFQLPGANAIAVSEGIRAKMKELKKGLPKGVEYRIVYDSTDFVQASIDEVVETLFIAFILVFLSVYVFLQDFRATLVPGIAIPVSLLGTFGVMMLLGFSINTLTLFGLILVIGIVVDDAIVVVENTIRLIDDEELPPKEATAKAMTEVTGPVIATTLVLLAVFVPTAFLGGITGQLYKQFALTIAVATVFSSVNALTLSPALCGLLLRPTKKKRGWFFRIFNRGFRHTTTGYMAVVRRVVPRPAVMVVLLAGLIGLVGYGFKELPTGFMPDEDQGYLFVNVQLPDAASLQRSDAVVDRVVKTIENTPGVKNVISLTGYSLLDATVAPNLGCAIVVLEPWEERTTPQTQLPAIVASLHREFSQIQEAIVFPFIPPAIQGLGQAGGFQYQLEDRGGGSLQQLQDFANAITFDANDSPVLTNVNTTFRANVPQLYLDVDREKVKRLGIPLNTVFETLQANLGSMYVNDYNKYGRVFKVMVQADKNFRNDIQDIARLKVRAPGGDMVPLSTLVTAEKTVGPQSIMRYQQYPSAAITGSATPGYSSGQAIAAMETISRDLLPPGMSYDWTGITYQEIEAGNMAPYIFSLAVVFVFLFLAAQYESWSIPLAVIFSIPLAILGALIGTAARGMDNNVYTQIGLVLLIGLASKNAILIVEFAKQRRAEGLSVTEAAIEASRLRFRPILMTAFSFLLGVIPLVVALGAGAASRRALGTAVFSGMLAATVLGVFFIPSLYAAVQRTSEWLRGIEK